MAGDIAFIALILGLVFAAMGFVFYVVRRANRR
jgi:hypothetical protein